MTAMPIPSAAIPCPRAALDQQIKALRTVVAGIPVADARRRFMEIEAALEQQEQPVRRRLLETELEWTDEDRDLARWLRDTQADLASIAHSLQLAGEQTAGPEACDLAARTLAHAGEAVKCDIGVVRRTGFDFRRAHSLMRAALAHHCERQEVTLRYEGQGVRCTIQALYWRALLLARFAGGTLTRKQVEILDAWLWGWMPVLSCGPDALAGSPLRADVDGDEGLKRGLRLDNGPSLYLSQEPLDRAHAALLMEFHAGRIVPSHGSAATFRIEDHVVVLDVIRREWRASKRALVARAERYPSGRPTELLVGLAEIARRGFTARGRETPPLALADDGASREGRPGGSAIDSIYEPERRHVRLLDESETGWGLEGGAKDCGAIAAGDLVALRLGSDEPLVVGRVVRGAPSKSAGRVVLGIRKVADNMRRVTMRRPNGEPLSLIYMPGREASGRHDAYLVADNTYEAGEPLQAMLDEATFTIRFNRIRERGRGWILAGFEVTTAATTACVA